MEIYAIDFETFYTKEYSVKVMGPEAYVADPRFDPYMVSIVGENLKYVGILDEAPWKDVTKQHWVSHNARFDETVFLRAQELGLIPQGIGPSLWDCTADLSCYMKAPRFLAGAAEVILGVKVSKDIRNKMLGLDLGKIIACGMLDEVLEYALLDSQLCLGIWNECSPNWPEHERQVSRDNRVAGHRGIMVNRKLLDDGLQKMRKVLFDTEKLIPWDWSKYKTPLAPSLVHKFCDQHRIRRPASMAKTSPLFDVWLEDYGDLHPWARALGVWRSANMFYKKLVTLESRLTEEDEFSFALKYFGGHTGRFSGDSGFNMQNLPGKPLFDVDLRGCLIPRAGHRFLIADYSQIEARILLWLAQDWETMDIVRSGVHIYEAHARRTMGWVDGILKEENPQIYKLAKARVLACGYGVGAKQFKVMAKILADVDVTPAEAASTVRDYRGSNPKIVATWQGAQREMAWSASRNEPYEIVLPSGRSLEYFDITSRSDGMQARPVRGMPKKYFYGAKVIENVCQAIARDVLVEGWLRLKRAGLPQMFTVHDEFVIEAQESENIIEDVTEILSADVAWLPGCPMGVDVKLVDQYEK